MNFINQSFFSLDSVRLNLCTVFVDNLRIENLHGCVAVLALGFEDRSRLPEIDERLGGPSFNGLTRELLFQAFCSATVHNRRTRLNAISPAGETVPKAAPLRNGSFAECLVFDAVGAL